MSKKTEDFVCIIDLGSSGIRTFGAKIIYGKIVQSCIEKFNFNKTYLKENEFLKNAEIGIKYTLDKIEEQLNHTFSTVWVTGRIGELAYNQISINQEFNTTTIITEDLIKKLLNEKLKDLNTSEKLLHIFPIKYQIDETLDNKNIITCQAKNLHAKFLSININNLDLENRIAMLDNAYLKPVEFIDEMTSISNIIDSKFKDNKILVIDLGANGTKFGILDKNKLLFSGNIELYGSEYLTQELAEKLETNRNIAELAKIYFSESTKTSLQDLTFTYNDTEYTFPIADIENLVLGWTTELFRNIFSELENNNLLQNLKYISFIGNGSKLRGVKQSAKQFFDIPIISLPNPEDIILQSAIQKICFNICEKMRDSEKNNLEWKNKLHTLHNSINKLFSKKSREIKNPIMPSIFSFPNHLSPILFKELEKNKIDIIHLDIMDGIYVNNKMGSVEEVRTIRKLTKAYLHTHLMVINPLDLVDSYANAGSDIILISSDSKNAMEAVLRVKELNKKVGIVIKPSLNLKDIKPFLDIVDEVMIMTVEPGFSGQEFIFEELKRIQKLYEYKIKYNYNWTISVDGGINPQTYEQSKIAGATRFVIGSYLAKSESLKKVLNEFKNN